MKLHFEPRSDDACKSRSASPVGGIDRERLFRLPIRLPKQEGKHWCWAAIAAALAFYYHRQDWSQTTVARRVVGEAAQSPGPGDDLDRCAMLSDALQLVGCYSHWSPGRPEFARLAEELAAGRPVCLRIAWDERVSHYVMVVGCDSHSREILVEDSLNGRSMQAFDDFPRLYRGQNGYWAETYWTTRSSTQPRPHATADARDFSSPTTRSPLP